jgi:hypothetical protein
MRWVSNILIAESGIFDQNEIGPKLISLTGGKRIQAGVNRGGNEPKLV